MASLKDKRGISLLITLVILSVLMAAAFGIASVFTREIKISSFVDDSVMAILAADAGLEKMLYDVRILNGSAETSYSSTLSNSATYTTCEDPSSCSSGPDVFTSTGTFMSTRRTLEATLASTQPPPPTILDVLVSNDAEERISNGDVNTSSSDLELIRDGSRNQLVGMRFTNLTIPQGSVITNAYIKFEADESDSGLTNILFYGEDINDSSPIRGSDYNISSRIPTTATVTWNNVPPWSTNEKHQTPNLSSIIQEIVSRPGWASGNDLTVIAGPGSGKRVAESYNGETQNRPLLHVEF